jgi:hypothetical protein
VVLDRSTDRGLSVLASAVISPKDVVSERGSRDGAVLGHAASYTFAASMWVRLFGDDRYCVDLHECAWASVSCGGNDRDGCAVIAPH